MTENKEPNMLNRHDEKTVSGKCISRLESGVDYDPWSYSSNLTVNALFGKMLYFIFHSLADIRTVRKQDH